MEREYEKAPVTEPLEDEDSHKTYTIYRITTPNGKVYVGYTSQELKERFRQHKFKALSGKCSGHPLYDAIRECSGQGVKIDTICCVSDKETAMLLEERNISLIPSEHSANLTRGGRFDGEDAMDIFWKRINSDSIKRTEYLKTLSQSKLANDWSDYENLLNCAEKWRKTNPKQAYKISYRAIRIANRQNGYPPPCHVKQDNRPLKERLMYKYKLNDVKRKYVTRVWAGRTAEERKLIGIKIGDAQKQHMESLTKDEKRKVTEKARASIDRSVQGPAASKGLKNWWVELKKNPERYSAYISMRNETNKRNREMRKNLLNSKENT